MKIKITHPDWKHRCTEEAVLTAIASLVPGDLIENGDHTMRGCPVAVALRALTGEPVTVSQHDVCLVRPHVLRALFWGLPVWIQGWISDYDKKHYQRHVQQPPLVKDKSNLYEY